MKYLEAIELNASYFGWEFVLTSAFIGLLIYLLFSEVLGALNCNDSVCLSLSLLIGMAATVSLYQFIMPPTYQIHRENPIAAINQDRETLPPQIESWVKNPCETECSNPSLIK